MTRADSAAANVAGAKMNCSQSVLTAFCEELGMDITLARKVSLGFGGGMGRSGKTCGAVTGSYMVMGLKQDLDPEKALQVKEKMYQLMKGFNQKFIEKHGSTDCKVLLGCDLSTPDGPAYAKEKGLFATICPKFVHDAVEILEQLGE
jgi:C_GCAxxG_C_C family probable redox protein